MSVIFLLIPLSIVIAACFLGAFIWAVRSGQFEDTCTPAMRVLLEEPDARIPSTAPGRHPIKRAAEAAGAREVENRAESFIDPGLFDRPSEQSPARAGSPFS